MDDLLFIGNNDNMILQLKKDMMKYYEMSDLRLLHYFLGIEVSHKDSGIFMSQKNYVENILTKFKLLGCKVVDTPLIPNEMLRKEDGAKKSGCCNV